MVQISKSYCYCWLFLFHGSRNQKGYRTFKPLHNCFLLFISAIFCAYFSLLCRKFCWHATQTECSMPLSWKWNFKFSYKNCTQILHKFFDMRLICEKKEIINYKYCRVSFLNVMFCSQCGIEKAAQRRLCNLGLLPVLFLVCSCFSVDFSVGWI